VNLKIIYPGPHQSKQGCLIYVKENIRNDFAQLKGAHIEKGVLYGPKPELRQKIHVKKRFHKNIEKSF
jgi:hypothetical protein